MNVDELAKKLAKELLKDQDLKMKTIVFFDDKKDTLDELHDEVIYLCEEWEEKYNKLSERMQESSRGVKIEESCDFLQSIVAALEEVDSLIDELKDHLEKDE